MIGRSRMVGKPGSVRSRLVGLAALLLLPGLAISALLTWRTYVTAREAADSGLRETARNLDELVDRELRENIVLLRTLAATDELRAGRLADFDRLARTVVGHGAALILSDSTGRQLVDTHLPRGAALPPGPPPQSWAAETIGEPVIRALATRPGSPRLFAQIVFPVGINGVHACDLMLDLPTGDIQWLLNRTTLPQGWIASIIDNSGLIVARSSDPARYVGQHIGPALRAGLTTADEGVGDTNLKDGTPVAFAFSRSPRSGWTAAVAVPRGLINQAGRQSTSLLIGLGSAAIMLGLLGAIRVARGIARPIEALAAAASALADHETLPPIQAGLAEADAVAEALAAATRTLVERREALIELNATLAARVEARTCELADANRALESQRGQLGLILDRMPIGVLVRLVDGSLTFINREARRLLGLPPGGAIDPAAWPVIRQGQVVLAPEDFPSARASAGIASERVQLTAESADGKPIELEINASPLRDSSGEVTLSVTTLQDVTARLEAEEARRRSQRLEAVGQLTGGVAHEFNNLLMAISGCLDLLAPHIAPADPASAATAREARAAALLANAARAAERGGRLTRQLLAFARRQTMQVEPLDLNKLVSGLKGLLEGTLGRKIEVDVILDPEAWPALADAAQLELVLLNLAINARDAMPAGGRLTIRTGNARLGPPFRPEDPPEGEHAVLHVSDTGQGMPPHVLARAFEPFFTTKDAGRGSGLGLPQVLGVAQQLGGGVAISSSQGEGTSVRVFLPRALSQPQPLPPAPRPVVTSDALRRVRLLLVDDDTDVREIARVMLEEMGAVVIEADSGAAALLELRTHPVDLVLADLTMPQMTGIELAAEIAAILPRLPVVLMTGYGQAAMGDPGPHVRATLLKPFRTETLARTLAAHLTPTQNPLPPLQEQRVL